MAKAIRQGERGRARSLLNFSTQMSVFHRQKNLSPLKSEAEITAARETGTSSSPGVCGSISGDAIFSPWQRELAEKRHRACCVFKFLVEQNGKGMMEASRIVARRYRGRLLKNRPTRRMALTPATALRIYHHWRNNGETPSALLLGYVYGRRFIDAALLVRFVNFAADREWPSFKAAWLAFCNRGGNYGPGRVNGRKLALKYDALRWNLPRGCFSQPQSQWKAIIQAQRKIETLRARFIGEIKSRVPAKLPRKLQGTNRA